MHGAVVSIVIPAKNAEKTVQATLSTVLRQSYRNLEVIFVDDGSDDATMAFVTSFDDSRLRFANGEGRGVSHARNIGLEVSKGKYIMFVDADDELENDAVALGVALLEQYDCDAVIGGLRKVWENGASQKCALAYDAETVYAGARLRDVVEATIGRTCSAESALNDCMLSGCWGRMIRADILRDVRFDESLSIGEDIVFNVAVLQKCQSVVVTPEVWYRYRQNASSAVYRYRKDSFQEGAAMMASLEALASKDFKNALRKRALFQLEGAVRQRVSFGCPEKTILQKARAVRSGLQLGYWNSFLKDTERIQGINAKHRCFLFLARHGMVTLLCGLSAMSNRSLSFMRRVQPEVNGGSRRQRTKEVAGA